MNKYEKEIRLLKKENRPIVLFGTLEMGYIGKKSMEFLEKKPVCFCDNDSEKTGTEYEKLPVLSVKELKEYRIKPVIYICSYSEESYRRIEEQLISEGFNEIRRSNVLFYIYAIYIMKRKVNRDSIAETLDKIQYKEQNLILHNVNILLTEKCTLNCQECAVLIPHFKKRETYDKEIIIESVEKLASSVDGIEIITLFGGEPLLHPDLIEISERISKIGNIKQVNIITNGTILLDGKTLDELFNNVTSIIISNYGELSTKKKELQKAAKEASIHVELLKESKTWSSVGSIDSHNREKDDNDQMFEKCYRGKGETPLIYKGFFYLCCISASLSKIGILKGLPNEEICLIDSSSIVTTRNKIKSLLNRKNSLSACDYCELALNNVVGRAVQGRKEL